MPEALTRKYATIESEAERLAVNPRTIRRMISRGELTGYRLGTKILRVDQVEVDAALRPVPTTSRGDAS
jgi:excisionase family DNA binding protein